MTVTLAHLLTDLQNNENGNYCHLPCSRHEYHTKVHYFHKHSHASFQENLSALSLYIMYTTMTTEIKEEHLVYDFQGLLTGIGGTLGLFLGYSLLSVLFDIINFFQRKSWHYKTDSIKL